MAGVGEPVAPADRGIGKIQRVGLREVWRHEALDFTTWLEHNADVLSDALGVTVGNIERERSTGTFSVDLVGEDEAGNAVIIENQLERSDHDHLGKLITYWAAFEARTAIWIVSDPRPEHVGAVTWLNESVAANFFLVKLEAIRIGDSSAAPLLTLITGPSAETRQVGVQKQERAERHDFRQTFWASLLEQARGQRHPHSGVSPGTDSWLSAGSGMSGVHFTYTVRQWDASVQVVLERPDAEENARMFEELNAAREVIEADYGAPLEWDRVDTRKRCFVGETLPDGGYRDEEERWPEIQKSMIESMIRLERTFRPRFQALRI